MRCLVPEFVLVGFDSVSMFLSLAEAFVNFPWMSNYQVIIDFFAASIDFLSNRYRVF